MKTRQELIERILNNAVEEANELLRHAVGVTAFVARNFPDEVPDRFHASLVKTTDTALLGKLRAPEESGRLMLDRCLQELEWELEIKKGIRKRNK